MKKIILKIFTFLFIVSANTLLAQEKEYELNSNPSLFSTVVSQRGAKISSTNKKLIIFTEDLISVSLPFIDDFSSNKFTSYDTADYGASAKSDSVRYSFRINGLIPTVDTIRYITDTAYSYTYYPDSNKLDSTALLPAFNLSFYNNLNTPNVVTDNFDVWNPYFRPVYDTIADTVSYYVLAKLDTIVILEIDSILFVNTHVFSSQTLWYENEVFVNSTYPINPPSIGVATFDGLDSTGYPYNFANPAAYGLADKLTSKYLDLGVPLGINDSFLFSFFYQPKGLGNTPESTDSLVLEFKYKKYDTLEQKYKQGWYHVWSSSGKPLVPDTAFKKVDITLTNNDSLYVYDGFQFRFKNYATLSGNVDHWHIDYVRLKKITVPADTLINDIAFVYPPESFLKDYYSVPYSQYDTTMMKSTISNTIVNLNSTPLNYGFYNYAVVDNNGNTISSYAPGLTNNIPPSYPGGNFIFQPATEPPINFNYSDTLGSCRDFIFSHERTGGTADQISTNDKTTLVQHITNYFAYDDASAESAYGVVQAGGQVALKFTLNKPDMISGVYVYFNPVVDNGANKIFKLTLWNDAGGLPGGIIYQNPQNYSPSYAHVIDGFFKLDLGTVYALPAGIFYVGWVQSTANELNVGLDKNNNHGDKLFYNIGSGWNQSIITGSLMLHPVFGSCPSLYICINERSQQEKYSLGVYPNPVQDKLFFKVDEPFEAIISMYDLTGKIILNVTQNISESINTSALSEGIYLVRIENKLRNTFVNKKIVVMK